MICRPIASRLLVATLLIIFAESICSAAVVRRFAVVVGANRGGAGRVPLRYAVSDAENFARLLQDLAGIRAEDCRLLREPSVAEFREALHSLRREMDATRELGARVEVILYFSGHADDQAVMLAAGRFSYQEIREEIARANADVNIVILDACASGAITRMKGGSKQPAFLVNPSANTRGYAFLTSSSENETAQESDRIRASFFTYYLNAALRGAADANTDGRVSLNEAYDFTYNETLGRTAKAQGGPQHPAYAIQMAGTGELILTDIREFSSILVLPDQLSGRLYVMNSDRQLAAELFKPAGRRTELGLEPGTYVIYLDTGSQFLAASLKLTQEQSIVLEKQLFFAAKKEPSILRGPSVYERYEPLQANKSRLEVLVNPDNKDVGVAYSYALREDFSLRISATRSYERFQPLIGFELLGDLASYEVLFGARYYPLKDTGNHLRPYVWAGYGPAVFRSTTVFFTGSPKQERLFSTSTTLCFQPGGGVDFFIGRRFVATLHGGYNIMGAEKPKRFEGALSFSILLGRGKN